MKTVLSVVMCIAVVVSVGCRKKSGLETVAAGSVIWTTAHVEPKLERYSPQNQDQEKQTAMGITPLHIAAGQGDVARIKQLLSEKSNPDAQDNGGVCPIHVAAWYGYADAVAALIEGGATPSSESYPEGTPTPLHLAAARGHTAVVELLLKKGANINATGMEYGYGKTPLQCAKECRQKGVASILTAAGAK